MQNPSKLAILGGDFELTSNFFCKFFLETFLEIERLNLADFGNLLETKNWKPFGNAILETLI